MNSNQQINNVDNQVPAGTGKNTARNRAWRKTNKGQFGTNQQLHEQLTQLKIQNKQLQQIIGHKPSFSEVNDYAKLHPDSEAYKLSRDRRRFKNQQRKYLEQVGYQTMLQSTGMGEADWAALGYDAKLRAERVAIMDAPKVTAQMTKEEYEANQRGEYFPPEISNPNKGQQRKQGFRDVMTGVAQNIPGIIAPYVPTMIPYMQQPDAFMNFHSKGVSENDQQAISLDHVVTVLHPEGAQVSRQPTPYSQDTAIAHGIFNFPVQTNNLGALGIYIFPNQPVVNNPSWIMSGGFYSVLNDPTFDAVSGQQAVDPDIFTGPLTTSLTNGAILEYKCTSFSVSFLPTTGTLNDQGEVQAMYWSKPFNATADNSQLIVTTESSMSLAEFYCRSPMRQGACGKRMIKIPSVSDAFQFIKKASSASSPPFQSGYYYLFTGCPPSVTIGQFEVAYTYEFVPPMAIRNYIATEMPDGGLQTIPALAAIFKEHRILQSMDVQTAKLIVEILKSMDPNTHDGLLRAVRVAVTKLPK